MKKELTCIVCPIGCRLCAELGEGNEVLSVSGNTCPRGKAYAEAELTHPTRTLTTTVAVEGRDGVMLPVKTDKPISKENLLAAMDILRSVRVSLPVKVGDIVYPNLFDEANVVATATIQ